VPVLVYIHGRGLKPPATVERKAWLDALNRGLQRLSAPLQSMPDGDHFRLAYWSDVFYPAGATAENAGLSAEQLTAVSALVRKFWQWRLPQPGTPATDPQTQQFEDNFVRDVVKFFGLGYAETCAKPLRDALAAVPAGDPVMLVSHSFGTVLAYEVLLRDLPGLNVSIDTWVTMGTPLGWAVDLQAHVPQWQEQLLVEIDQGLQPVLSTARGTLSSIGDFARRAFDSVFGQRGPSVFEVPPKQFPPVGVDRWFNIYDPRDPVACAGGFGAVLGGLAIGETYLYADEQRAFDITIRNDACPPNVLTADMRAHEDFEGYGQCAQLAQLVSDFWTRHGGTWT
jgi:hypothetical protein